MMNIEQQNLGLANKLQSRILIYHKTIRCLILHFYLINREKWGKLTFFLFLNIFVIVNAIRKSSTSSNLKSFGFHLAFFLI